MKRTHVFTIVLILTLLVSLQISCKIGREAADQRDPISKPKPVDESDTGEVVSEAQPDQVYQAGEVVRMGDTMLVVLGWDIYPGGSQFPPEEGLKHLGVEVMVGNQGKDTVEFSPGHALTVRGPSDEPIYMNSISGYVTGSISPDGEIAPGEVMRGKVGFQVPEDQTEFVLIFEGDQGEIPVNLGSSPVSLPPVDLGLPLQQEIFQIGDAPEILGQVIRVLEVAYPPDEEIIRPVEGSKSVVLQVEVENQADDTLYFTGSDQIYLKDATGQKYSEDSLALPDGADDHVIGSLEPGEKIQGRIGFMVPNEAGGLILVFDPDPFEIGKVFISLD